MTMEEVDKTIIEYRKKNEQDINELKETLLKAEVLIDDIILKQECIVDYYRLKDRMKEGNK